MSDALSSVVLARFWAKIDRSGGPDACWPWTASGVPRGYGLFYPSGRGSNVYAHRLAFELRKGPIPNGEEILHSCDNPPCCNPAHLSAGTRADNMRDCVAKGRHARNRLPGELHPGHKLTEAQVREIRTAAASGEKQRDIAARYGVTRGLVGQIHRRRAWAHLCDEVGP